MTVLEPRKAFRFLRFFPTFGGLSYLIVQGRLRSPRILLGTILVIHTISKQKASQDNTTSKRYNTY